MQRLKTGKEEIVYLLSKVVAKYKQETGHAIIQNTNRKNYEVVAIALSEISNQLPYKWEIYGTDLYSPEENNKNQNYPYRKYDITGGQIKDALNGIVSTPRSFLVDACYIYLYGVGKKTFEQNPTDENLFENANNHTEVKIIDSPENNLLKAQLLKAKTKSKKAILVLASLASLLIFGLTLYYFNSKNKWDTIKKDLNYLPYKPTVAEIDSLEGIWLCYTGSPQARISDPERYHKVVSNIVEIKYKNGYFTYNRFGASFNHIGYVQLQSPGIVSIYSRIKNQSNTTESPRHSLLNLNDNTKFLSAISASWNFDTGDRNKIIGIREIYIKQGKGGNLQEVINEIENASCKCKIIRWYQNNNEVKTFYLKNELLDSLPMQDIKALINEKSILVSTPQPGLVINKDSLQ